MILRTRQKDSPQNVQIWDTHSKLLGIVFPDSPYFRIKPSQICCFLQYSNLTFKIQRIIIDIDISSKISQGMKILKTLQWTQTYSGLRRTKSFRDYLTHTDLEKVVSIPLVVLGHFKCHKCTACRLSWECKEFSHPQGLGTFKINHFSNCSTKYSIYIIFCAYNLVYWQQLSDSKNAHPGVCISYKK